MKRRLPIVPTLFVLAAIAVMIRLGFWQLDRLHEKEAMIARYEGAQADQSIHEWPAPSELSATGYIRVRFMCETTVAQQAISGRNAADEPGWAHVALCNLANGQKARAVLGWSNGPDSVPWTGGQVIGTLVPRDNAIPQVVADPPLAGLQANARPDPRDIPNNHLSYAIQWFLFAATALVIYLLALRKRLHGR